MKKAVPPFIKIIGQNLRRIREENNWSQKMLADYIGVTFQQIQKYEHGINRLPIESLYMVAQKFEIPMEFFFEGCSELHPVEGYLGRIPDQVVRYYLCSLTKALADF